MKKPDIKPFKDFLLNLKYGIVALLVVGLIVDYILISSNPQKIPDLIIFFYMPAFFMLMVLSTLGGGLLQSQTTGTILMLFTGFIYHIMLLMIILVIAFFIQNKHSKNA